MRTGEDGNALCCCESLSVPYRDTIFMKEVIREVWGIGEGLVTDLRGVFVFLMLQKQLLQWPKPSCGGCRSGRADGSGEQKCRGSTLAPVGNAVVSGTSCCAPRAEPAVSAAPGEACTYLKIRE